ncbi:MAG TPA: glycosyltransferase family 39 protein [Polyangiaceae bacterium]|nr:glycosyltransferase family 39 protein [Polyangiaceae bacterium]
MNRTKEISAGPRLTSDFRLESSQLVRTIELLLTAVIVVASVVPLARFVQVALLRVGYPFDLEWCEGGTLAHIRVVLAGQHIYREPSLEFTPYLYPPLYYYVSALPSLVFGAGHFAPRLVSLLSILGCFVLLGRWVRDETDDPVAGLAAVGLLCATYQLTGYWFELARVDAFFLLLIFGSHMTARTAKTPARAATVGVLIAAACFTKQLGIPLALPPLLLLSMRSLRLGMIAAGVSGALVLVTGLAFYISSDGWFLYYVLDLPSRHEIEIARFWPSLQTFFLSNTFPMTLAGVTIVCGVTFGRRRWKRWLFHALFVGLACTTSFLPFLKSGGYPNGLIPAYAALALASGIGLGILRRSQIRSALGSIGPRLAAAAVLLIQFAVLDYDPKPALPSEADLQANKEVIARLSALQKPLFVTGSSFYTIAAGGENVMTDTMGLIDIIKGGGPQAKKLDAVLSEAIHRHRFKTIVLDRAAGFLPENIVSLIRQEYVPQGSVLHGLPPDVIWPRSGASVRPDSVWVAR